MFFFLSFDRAFLLAQNMCRSHASSPEPHTRTPFCRRPLSLPAASSRDGVNCGYSHICGANTLRGWVIVGVLFQLLIWRVGYVHVACACASSGTRVAGRNCNYLCKPRMCGLAGRAAVSRKPSVCSILLTNKVAILIDRVKESVLLENFQPDKDARVCA